MQIIPSVSGIYPYQLAPLPDALSFPLKNHESEKLGPLPPPPSKECRTCHKEGSFKTRLRDETVVECECNCTEQWLLGRHLLNAGIGDAYQRYSWNHVRAVSEPVLAQVHEYIENMRGFVEAGAGLLLWSPRFGSGKSLLTYLVLKEALSQGISGYFTSFSQMTDHYTASWSSNDHKEWFTKKIQNVGMLGIDEIGKENAARSGVVNELLDKVVRDRVANARPTMIATNLNPDQPEGSTEVGKDFSRYHAGLVDLLSECSMVIEVSGPSYREKKRELLMRDVRDGVRYPVVIR